MYKCEICSEVSGPRQPLIKHIVYRQRPYGGGMEIAKEVAVCQRCKLSLEMVPLSRLIAMRAPMREKKIRQRKARKAEAKAAKQLFIAQCAKSKRRPAQLTTLILPTTPARPKRLAAFDV